MKALVCSGGGNRIAFIAGLAEKLFAQQPSGYDFIIGTSAGSLSIPFLALNQVKKFRDIILSITNHDIYTVSPFKSYMDEDENWVVKPDKLNILWNYLTQKYSVGNTKMLLRTIRKNFTKKDYETLKSLNKKSVVTVTNLTTGKSEYKHLEECTYEEACQWVWASTCVPVFMSVLRKNDCVYVDGGVKDHAPVQYAIDLGADEIDVILLETERNDMVQCIHNVFGIAMATIETMHEEIKRNDIRIAQLIAGKKMVTLNLYYMPENPKIPSLIFHPEIMQEIYEIGKNYNLDNPDLSDKILIGKYKKIQMPS